MPSNKPKFTSGKKSAIKIPTSSVGAWLTNFGKSIGYSAQEVLAEVLPATAETVTTTAQNLQEFKDKMRELRTSGKRLQEMADANIYYQLGHDAIKNAKEAIKTGKFYDKSKIESMAGNDFDMGDFGNDFDFDDSFDMDISDGTAEDRSVSENDNGDVNVTNIKVNMDIGRDSPMVQSINEQTRITIETAERAEKLTKINNTALISQLNGLTNKLDGSLGALNENVATVATTMTTTVSQHASLSAKYYSDSMDVFNKIYDQLSIISQSYQKAAEEQQKDYDDALDLFGANGSLNLGAYTDTVKKQFKRAVEGNLILSNIANIASDTDTLKMMIQNPLSFVPKKVISTIFTKTMQDSAKAFDETLSQTMVTVLHRVRSLEGNDNPILDFIGKTFGIGNKVESQPDKSKYVRGKVDWDGESRKTLIEVIPYYLRKITAALTGTNEMGFDYNQGTFRSIKDMSESYEKDRTRKLTSGLSDVRSDFSEFVNKELQFKTTKEKEDVLSVADDFIKKLANSKGNPLERKGDSFYQSIAKLLGDSSKDAEAQILAGWFDALPNNYAMSLSGKILESQREYSKFMRDIESGKTASNYMYVNNGTAFDDMMKKDAAGKITDQVDYSKSLLGGSRDKYGNTSTDYLRKILNTLAEGIRVFVAGNATGNAVGGDGRHSIVDYSNKILRTLQGEYDRVSDREASDSARRNRAATEDEITRATNQGREVINRDEVNRRSITSLAREHIIQQNQESEDNSIDWFLRLTGLKSDDPLSKFVNKIAKITTQKPSETITSMFKTADDFLFKVAFGGGENETPLLKRAGAYIKGYFKSFSTFLNDKVFIPLRDVLFDEKTGLITQLKQSKFATDLKDIGNKVKTYLLGARAEDGKYSGGLFSDIATELSGMGKSIKESFIGKGPDSVWSNVKGMASSAGHSFMDALGFSGEASKQSDTPIKDALDRARDMIKERTTAFLDDTLGTDSERSAYITNIQGDLAGKRGKLGAGAVTGAIMSFIMPGGMIFNALAGLGITAVKESETLQKTLFGYTDQDGKRRDGLISQNIVDLYNENKRGIKIGLGAAALAKFGLLPAFLAPGGPIGAALLGLGGSLIYKSDQFQEFLYGPDDGSGNRVGGGFADKVKSAFSNVGISKDSFIDAGIGAGIGFLGGFLLPTGPIGTALLGAGAGIALSSDMFRNYLFGEKEYDAEGKSLGRHGGLLGKAVNKINDAIDIGVDYINTKFIIPFSNALLPIAYSTLNSVKKLGSAVGHIIIGKKDKNGNLKGGIIGTALGMIIGNKDDDGSMKGGILSPLLRAATTASSHILKGAAYIAAAPGRLVERIGIALDAKNRFDKMFEPVTNALAKLGEGMHNMVKDLIITPVRKAIVDPLSKGIKKLMKLSWDMTFGLAGKLIKGIFKLTSNTLLAPVRLLGAATTMLPAAVTGKGHEQDKTFMKNTFGQMFTGKDAQGNKASRLKGFTNFFTNSEARKTWETTGRMDADQALPYHGKDSRSGMYMTTAQKIHAEQQASNAWTKYRIGVRNGTIDPRTGLETTEPIINPDTGKPYTKAELKSFLSDKTKFLTDHGHYVKPNRIPKATDDGETTIAVGEGTETTADDVVQESATTTTIAVQETSQEILETIEDTQATIVNTVNDTSSQLIEIANNAVDILTNVTTKPDEESGGETATISVPETVRDDVVDKVITTAEGVTNVVVKPDEKVDDDTDTAAQSSTPSPESGGFKEYIKSIPALLGKHDERSGFIFGENSVFDAFKKYRKANMEGDLEEAQKSKVLMRDNASNTLLGRITQGLFGDSIFGQNPKIESNNTWKKFGLIGGLYRKLFGDKDAEEGSKANLGLVGSITHGITNFFKTGFDTIKNSFIGKLISTAFTVMVGGAVLGHGAKFFSETLWPVLSNTFTSVKAWVVDKAVPWVDGALTNIFGDSWTTLKEKLGGFVDKIFEPDRDTLYGKVFYFFKDFADAVTGEREGGIGKWFKDKVLKPSYDFIVDGWKNLWTYLGEPLTRELRAVLYEWWANKGNKEKRDAALLQSMTLNPNVIADDTTVTVATTDKTTGTTQIETMTGAEAKAHYDTVDHNTVDVSFDSFENLSFDKGYSAGVAALYSGKNINGGSLMGRTLSGTNYIIFIYNTNVIYVSNSTAGLKLWLEANLPDLQIKGFPNLLRTTTPITGWYLGSYKDLKTMLDTAPARTSADNMVRHLSTAIFLINSIPSNKNNGDLSRFSNPDNPDDKGYAAFKMLHDIRGKHQYDVDFFETISSDEHAALNKAYSSWSGFITNTKKSKAQTAISDLNDLLANDGGNGVGVKYTGKPSSIKNSQVEYSGNGAHQTVNNFPYYSQNDSTIKDRSYRYSGNSNEGSASETMGNRGCGPTAMAMVYDAVMGGDSSPMRMARLAESQGYSNPSGTTPAYFSNVGTQLGMNVTEGMATPANLYSLLGSEPVIIQGRSDKPNSPYTSSGHYVVAVGKDSSGNVIVNDPRGRQYSGKYTIKQIMDGSARMWGFSRQAPFGGNGGLNSNASAEEQIAAILKTAQSYVGYLEKGSNKNLDSFTDNAGTANWTMFGPLYNQYMGLSWGAAAWCAIFISCIFVETFGLEQAKKLLCGNLFSKCSIGASQFVKEGRFITSDPQPGDIVFFRWKNSSHDFDHVGIVETVNSDGTITTIEGNTKANGKEGVFRQKRNTSVIVGYGRPEYNGVIVSETVANVNTSNNSSTPFSLAAKLLDFATTVGGAISESLFDTSTRPSVTTNNLTGNTNAEKIWNYFRNKGYTKAATAGILGNLYAESGLSPNNVQNAYENTVGSDESYTSGVDYGVYKNFVGDSVGYGLAQWTSSGRKANLLNAAKDNKTSIADIGNQLDYMHKEAGDYVPGFEKLISVDKAARRWMTRFEMPRDQSKAAQDARVEYALKYYNDFSGNGEGVGVGESTPNFQKNYTTEYRTLMTKDRELGGNGSTFTNDDVLEVLGNMLIELQGTNIGINKFNEKELKVENHPVVVQDNSNKTIVSGNGNQTVVPTHTEKRDSFMTSDQYSLAKRIAAGSYVMG